MDEFGNYPKDRVGEEGDHPCDLVLLRWWEGRWACVVRSAPHEEYLNDKDRVVIADITALKRAATLSYSWICGSFVAEPGVAGQPKRGDAGR